MTSLAIDPPGTEPAWPRASYAWFVAVLLTLAYALAILDRVSIALLIQPLQAAFKITDTQFGLLQGMAFSLVYSLLGLPLGMLSDRWHRKPILLIGLVLWSGATIASGFAHDFTQLFAARMMVGVGEAALVPVAVSLIADYFAPAVRPKAYGLFVCGSSIGTAAAMAASGTFLASADRLIAGIPLLFGGMQQWQLVFMLCGAPGLVLTVILALFVREPVRRGITVTATSLSFRPVLALFARNPVAFGCLIGGTVLNLVCTYAIVGWFPALFIRVHGWSAPETGWILGMVGMPISLFAAVNSGWVIVWLTRRGHRSAPMLAAAASGASFLLFGTAACLAPSAGIALACYALNSFFLNWNISGVYSGLSQITPNDMRGQVMAVHTIASGLIAQTAGNFAVGFLSDTAFKGPGGVAPALATVFVVCSGSAALILFAGRHAFRRAAEQMEK